MNWKNSDPLTLLVTGGILFISTLILSEFFSEMIPFGGIIFAIAALFGIYLLILGVKKNIQQVLKERE